MMLDYTERTTHTADAARLSLNPQFTARFSAIFDQLVSLTKHLEEYDDEDETLVSEHDDSDDSVASCVSPISHSFVGVSLPSSSPIVASSS
jgi:hypothetical protein